jgi:DNA-binding NarL/FixJ family response regulator
MTDGAIERLGRLTGPEIQVMNLAAVGMENERIASVLKISIHSVKKRLELIYDKLNIHEGNVRVKLANYALNEGVANLFSRPNRKPKMKL